MQSSRAACLRFVRSHVRPYGTNRWPDTNALAAYHFRALLSQACEHIDDPWFLLPIDRRGGAKGPFAYRERVYCYEPYHQIRLRDRTPTNWREAGRGYALSGEIDKAGLNAVIKGGKEKPDLVWHIPGCSSDNVTVVEVKAWPVELEGVCKDLATLGKFTTAGDRSYHEGLLLLYSYGEPKVVKKSPRP